jgi:hypothetical protein
MDVKRTRAGTSFNLILRNKILWGNAQKSPSFNRISGVSAEGEDRVRRFVAVFLPLFASLMAVAVTHPPDSAIFGTWVHSNVSELALLLSALAIIATVILSIPRARRAVLNFFRWLWRGPKAVYGAFKTLLTGEEWFEELLKTTDGGPNAPLFGEVLNEQFRQCETRGQRKAFCKRCISLDPGRSEAHEIAHRLGKRKLAELKLETKRKKALGG